MIRLKWRLSWRKKRWSSKSTILNKHCWIRWWMKIGKKTQFLKGDASSIRWQRSRDWLSAWMICKVSMTVLKIWLWRTDKQLIRWTLRVLSSKTRQRRLLWSKIKVNVNKLWKIGLFSNWPKVIRSLIVYFKQSMTNYWFKSKLTKKKCSVKLTTISPPASINSTNPPFLNKQVNLAAP